jgi:hypothetical protein
MSGWWDHFRASSVLNTKLLPACANAGQFVSTTMTGRLTCIVRDLSYARRSGRLSLCLLKHFICLPEVQIMKKRENAQTLL